MTATHFTIRIAQTDSTTDKIHPTAIKRRRTRIAGDPVLIRCVTDESFCMPHRTRFCMKISSDHVNLKLKAEHLEERKGLGHMMITGDTGLVRCLSKRRESWLTNAIPWDVHGLFVAVILKQTALCLRDIFHENLISSETFVHGRPTRT